MPEVVLETIGLTKDFHGRRAVDNLNLRVFEGDVYGFLGPNGAGKSTTIRMLTGLVRPNRGSVRLLSKDISTDRTSALRGVGALVETPGFYKYLSARENLRILSRLSDGADSRQIDEVLDIVGLLDRADDKVRTFSHGMLQRLGIAQALLPKPRLVILDEPTSGLDPQGMRDVRELIKRLARDHKVTIFLSSHLLYEVEQICTKVGIINRGKLRAEGEVRELLGGDAGRVELRVDNTAKALSVLDSLDWVKVTETSGDRVSLRLPYDRIGAMNKCLVSAGVDVQAIIPQSSCLEDIFLRLTEGIGYAD